MHIFFVLALLEGHIGLQVPVPELQQLVILLQLALVFLEQFVVQVLVVDGRIVHRDVEAGLLHLPAAVLCYCFIELLQFFGY